MDVVSGCNFEGYTIDSFLASLAVKFPYLAQKKLKPGQEVRRVAQLDWITIESDLTKPFVASGLQFVPLPVSFVFFFLF